MAKITNELLNACKDYVESGGVTVGAVFTTVPVREFKLLDIDANAAAMYLDQNRERLFTEQLFAFIDRTGRSDCEIYKKARIDRRLFSKIRSNKKYIPAKKTVIALCLALELSREEADKLLSSAGYGLSRAEDYDLVIAFCMEKKIFDFFDINEALVHFGLEPF